MTTGVSIRDVKLLQPRVFVDDRGHFFESYNAETFAAETGHSVSFVQDNESRSIRHVLRGLHYQVPPRAQGKLVRCVKGAVWDVVVDIRQSSETFGRWFGTELTEENHTQLWIPAGFAHGFIVVSEEAVVFYKTTDHYAPECDRSIRWNDPAIGIDWPLPGEPALSEKDAKAPLLAEADLFP